MESPGAIQWLMGSSEKMRVAVTPHAASIVARRDLNRTGAVVIKLVLWCALGVSYAEDTALLALMFRLSKSN